MLEQHWSIDVVLQTFLLFKRVGGNLHPSPHDIAIQIKQTRMGIIPDQLGRALDDQIAIPQDKADMAIHHTGQPVKYYDFFEVEKRRLQFP